MQSHHNERGDCDPSAFDDVVHAKILHHALQFNARMCASLLLISQATCATVQATYNSEQQECAKSWSLYEHMIQYHSLAAECLEFKTIPLRRLRLVQNDSPDRMRIPFAIAGNYNESLAILATDRQDLHADVFHEQWSRASIMPRFTRPQARILAMDDWACPKANFTLVRQLFVQVSFILRDLFQDRGRWVAFLTSFHIKLQGKCSTAQHFAFCMAFGLQNSLLQCDTKVCETFVNMPWSWQECVFTIIHEIHSRSFFTISPMCNIYVRCDCGCSAATAASGTSSSTAVCVKDHFAQNYSRLSERALKVFHKRYDLLVGNRAQCHCVVCWAYKYGNKIIQASIPILFSFNVLPISIRGCVAVLQHMGGVMTFGAPGANFSQEDLIKGIAEVVYFRSFFADFAEEFQHDAQLRQLLLRAVLDSPDMLCCMLQVLHECCTCDANYVHKIAQHVVDERVEHHIQTCHDQYVRLQNLQAQAQPNHDFYAEPDQCCMPLLLAFPVKNLVQHGLFLDCAICMEWYQRIQRIE